MINTDYFRNKKVTVAGLARSGLACANLLFALGASVSVTDQQDNDTTRANAAKLKSKDIKIELGRHTQDFISGRDLLVVSPGVPENALPVAWARQAGIPVISEIEVSWLLCPATIIAVTGSNGKTTVTTLIGKILEAAGKRVFVLGNIGKPFCAELEKMKEGDFVSLEVSSFQLETIDKFKPKVAVILNFSRNHLDRYKDMRKYLAAKKRIFLNQDKTDYAVLNYQDRLVRELAKEVKSQAVYFKEEESLNPNQAAVLAVGSILGIDKGTCMEVFRGFKGVEHRLESVAEIGGIEFINDSKSTTVESTAWALETLKKPVILIAGGRDKNLDYRPILDLARRKVKKIILIGEAKEKIRRALNGFPALEDASTLEEALDLAYQKSSSGDCVLLSPMCASFDMFSDYEDRGRVFKKAVYNLMTNNKAQNSPAQRTKF
jgi:UDP-N-acetylmuramoylalanine--D-glutamate ligase